MPKLGPSVEFSSEFSGPGDVSVEGPPETGTELALFNFSCVAVATNNFSDENKLGEGGFGHVYKVISLQQKRYIVFFLCLIV